MKCKIINPPLLLLSLVTAAGMAAQPEVPKVNLIRPLKPDPLSSAPGVFFYESLESINKLSDSFHDIGTDDGRFLISRADAMSGKKSIQQKYLPITSYPDTLAASGAGWAWRFFGDSPITTNFPEEQRKPYTTAVARWYHKFEERFQPRDGKYFPPKMARMRCFAFGDFNPLYSVLFWIGGEDGHLSIERHTKAPNVHREWQPNFSAKFKFSEPVNVGRWIHFELRVSLGEGPRSDRIQAWADGLLICDVAGDDLAGGYKDYTLNGMSWDCYWNGGSPVEQSRYYDDLMLSTERIGPVRTGFNPVIVKSAFSSSDPDAEQAAWEVEVARAVQQPLVREQVIDRVVTQYEQPEIDCTVVWKGTVAGDTPEVRVDAASGEFTGPLAGQAGLEPNTLHFVRVRQQDDSGNWSEWSVWHAGFATTWAEGTPEDEKTLPAGYLAEAEAAVLAPDSTAPVIEQARRLESVADTSGPYTITAEVTEENLLGVYLYYRKTGDEDFSYVRMNEENGVFAAGIPGHPAGTAVEYYIRAVDGFENESRVPASGTYSFEIIDPLSCDFNSDGRVNVLDVISLILAGISRPDDPAVDYNGDGGFSLGDALAMMHDFVRTRPY